MAAWGDWEIFFLSILAAEAEIASWWGGAGLQVGRQLSCGQDCGAPVPALAGCQPCRFCASHWVTHSLRASSWFRKAYSSFKWISPFSNRVEDGPVSASLSRYGCPLGLWTHMGPLFVSLMRSFL